MQHLQHSPPRWSRAELAWFGVIALALAAIYLPGLANEPLFDDSYLVEGRLRADYASLAALQPRALSYGSFVWLEALVGGGWWKQRLANLAIHLGVVAALWGFYREMLRHVAFPEANGGHPQATAAALAFGVGFFAINPVAVYAVGYLIQRSILLATLFVVLGLWAFARAVATRRALPAAAAVACYALGVLSKEHALFAPLAAVPVYVLVARPPARRLVALGLAGAAVVGLAGALLAQRYGHVLGVPFDEYSHVYLGQLARLDPGAPDRAFGLSIINQAYLFFEYGLRWLVPWSGWMSINLRPPFPLTLATFPQALGPLLLTSVVALGAFLLLRYRDGRALAGLSLLVPALLFATEFLTVWVQDPFVLYRSYLWAVGVPGLVMFLVHGTPARALAAAAVVVGSLMGWQALDRVFSLGTPESAWSDAIAKLPNDERSVGRWFPYLNRGGAYVRANNFNLAMKDFEASSRLGDMGMGALNMGSLYAANGQHLEALQSFDRAAAAGLDLYNLPFQRGLSLLALGRHAEAYEQFERTRAMSPPSPTRELMLAHLARLGMELGRADAAIERLREWIALEPRSGEARRLLGMAHVMRRENEQAIGVFDALVKEERSSRAHYGRALAYFGLGRKAQALADIDAAIRLDPGDAHLRQWRERIAAMP